ncbi:MAG: hypothetical protein Q9163_000216 [Psora crenata]
MTEQLHKFFGTQPIFSPKLPRTPSISPQRAAPSSPNKRRRCLQRTDDNEGEMSIEAFLYRCDDYRSTTARTAFPLPLLLEKAPEPLANQLEFGSELRSEILAQLRRHNIDPYELNFLTQSKPGYPGGGNKAVSALHVSIDVPDGETTSQWSPAKRAVQSLLEDYGLSDIEVELQDPKRCSQPELLAIGPGHNSINQYESCRHEIVKYVDRELRDSWKAQSIFEVRADNTAVAAITHDVVIVVEPFTRCDWSTFCANIQQILSQAIGDENGDIGVRILTGGCGFLPGAEETERPGRSFVDLLKPDPMLGASIGVESELGGGTLGGYMTLEIGGKIHRGWLTNSHVVAPSENTNPETRKQYDTLGVSLADDATDQVRTRVHWMAIKDQKATQDDITKNKRFSDSEKAALEATIAEREECGRRHRSEDLQLTALNARCAHFDAVMNICAQRPAPMGNVLFSTGRALSASKNILDTAFVEIPKADQSKWNHCMVGNELPRRTAAGLFNHLPENYRLEGVGYAEPPYVTGIGPLVKGNWYFKVGRTTGITTGICHGTEVYVSLGGTGSQYDEQGIRGAYENVGYTEESVILLSKQHNIGDPTSGPFCQSGDSGSFIIDVMGRVVAQLYGYLEHYCQRPPEYDDAGDLVCPSEGLGVNQGNYYGSAAGLVTPMERIMEAVDLMTAPRHPRTGERTAPGGVLDIAV